jgi:hypothetical protein
MTELAEGARLEIVCSERSEPRVRIPLSPPGKLQSNFHIQTVNDSSYKEIVAGFKCAPIDGTGRILWLLLIARSYAAEGCKPRQIRKEAAVATLSG